MRVLKIAVAVLMLAAAALAQSAPEKNLRLDQVIDRVTQQEAAFMDSLHDYSPLVETYIQEMRPEQELGMVPSRDQYFLTKADFSQGIRDRAFLGASAGTRRHHLSFLSGKFSSPFAMKYVEAGFLQGIILDTGGFDQSHYKFEFLRREFLGDVRCLVFDVTPRKGSGQGRFLGRIWVEDQDYHVVRFSGVRVNASHFHYYFHFDSWRLNMGPGVWLPAYVYSEENDLKYGTINRVYFKAQTRLWGYNLKTASRQDEMTTVLVEAPAIADHAEQTQDRGPLEALHAWQRQSEDNVVDRMERAGLLAPRGDVEKVLDTVVNNILVTNNIDIQPEVRCRVLLTAPLESFTMAHTIVVSRGLIDTLPDEASLAMVLAHELGHVILAHAIDTRWAFSDRMIFSDYEAFSRLDFRRSPAEEQAADEKAVQLLQKSPYAGKLNEGGLFLRVLAARSKELPNLVTAHLGNRLALGDQVVRMQTVAQSAPELKLTQVDQISALPLGARLKLDPWTDRVEMMKSKPVAATSAREKMPFEVTPFAPFLSRRPVSGAAPVSGGTTAQATPAITPAAPPVTADEMPRTENR
ncbi:MAG TPA: M48 family metalloprotease [Terriglobales bacterium]|nr:M48 family metalloprotease [Terriglobales bacterium]